MMKLNFLFFKSKEERLAYAYAGRVCLCKFESRLYFTFRNYLKALLNINI